MSNISSSKRRATAVGLAAGLIGGGAAGLIFGVPGLTSAAGGSVAVVAQPTDDTTTDDTTTDDTTTDDTTTDDTTIEDSDLRPEPGERLRELLQQLVEDGTLTSEQADTVASFLVENRPPGRHGGFPGHGRGWPGPGRLGPDRGEIAELLGLEPQELRDLLRDGQSLADIATANGVDVQAVIDTLVSEAKEHLDQAVGDGRLTQEQADARLAELTERVTEMVNATHPAAD